MREDGTDHGEEIETAQEHLDLSITQAHGIFDKDSGLARDANIVAQVTAVQSRAEAEELGRLGDGDGRSAVSHVPMELALMGLLQFGTGAPSVIGHCCGAHKDRIDDRIEFCFRVCARFGTNTQNFSQMRGEMRPANAFFRTGCGRSWSIILVGQ